MKHLYIVGGAMGVGKTAVGRELLKALPHCAFLDGDWCWTADPFTDTPQTREMAMANACFLLNGFLRCSAYDNIVFCWVLHEQRIIDELLSRLELEGCEVRSASLVCSEEALVERLRRDIAAGVRSEDIVRRSVARLPMYGALNTLKLDVTRMAPAEAARALIAAFDSVAEGGLPDAPR
ncbi:MAG: AAA family ATPase [Clostridia bacterium]|nr:AAA family ATPase [Clostridia bacterium]